MEQGVEELYARCTSGPRGLTITGLDVSHYAQSPFRYYCNRFVDRNEADPASHNAKSMGEEGRAYEEKVMGPSVLKYDGYDDGFKKTLELMFGGESEIRDAPLLYVPDNLSGKPDMLRRMPGESVFGSHYYAPIEVKMSIRLKFSHAMQAAFYSHMLYKIQGRRPEYYMIDGRGSTHRNKPSKHVSTLMRLLAGINNVRTGRVPPAERLGSPWSGYSVRKALETGHPSLISGLNRRDLAGLRACGLYGIGRIAGTTNSTLMNTLGFDRDKAKMVRGRARAILGRRPIVYGTPGLAGSGTVAFLSVGVGRGEGSTGGEMRRATILIRERGAERHGTSSDSPPRDVMDWICGHLPEQCTLYHWGRTPYLLMRESGGTMPETSDLLKVFLECTYFHVPFEGPNDISAEMGKPVEGGMPGECTAIRNIHDWLYRVRQNDLDGKRDGHAGYVRERN